jgi:uncharacterized membrane protein
MAPGLERHMKAEVFALLSAMTWSVDSILVRLGARNSNVVAAAFLGYSVTVIFLWSYLSLYFPFHLLSSPSTIYFILSGCFQPLLARILYYMGITRLGVSRAGPLFGTTPLFGVILAMIFLQERPTPFVYGGTFLTVASVWLVSSRRSGEGEWRVFDTIYPLGAAFFAAVSQNLRKAGLLILPDPFAGAAISTSTSLIIFSIFLLLTGRARLITTHRKSLPFFGSAALVSTTAQLLTFMALSRGEVSAVIPILNTNPLFALLFSGLFLRDVEKITMRVVLGAVLMVIGVILITSR